MAPLVIGAAVGAGTAAATGGDPKKGALYGAVGGAVGAGAAGSAGITSASIAGQAVAPATFGAVAGGVGGSIAGRSITKRLTPGSLSPVPMKETLATAGRASPRPQAVALESVKQRMREEAKKRRGFMSTVLTRGGLGSAQTQKAKVLGA